MPPLTRLFVKTSLVYLVAALATGLLLAMRPLVTLPAVANSLAPVYFHLLTVGWVAQLIFGIVYWMFPKYSKEQPRGREWLAWAVYYLINAGLILRVVGEPMYVTHGGGWGSLLGISALLQWLAGMAFAANTWSRVKER